LDFGRSAAIGDYDVRLNTAADVMLAARHERLTLPFAITCPVETLVWISAEMRHGIAACSLHDRVTIFGRFLKPMFYVTIHGSAGNL